jgi:predicted dinucleotide-binding enzyme
MLIGHVPVHWLSDGRLRSRCACDDQTAEDAVAAIYDAVGFDTLDLGGLGEAWRVDRADRSRADRSRSGR